MLPRTGSVVTALTVHGSSAGRVSCSSQARRGDDERMFKAAGFSTATVRRTSRTSRGSARGSAPAICVPQATRSAGP